MDMKKQVKSNTNSCMEKHSEYMSPFAHEELMDKLRKIKHVALDMDGTIYMGSTLFPFTKQFLSDLSNNGIGYSFLTNNPTKSQSDYLQKLKKLGIEADPEAMYTSSIATIEYLKVKFPDAKNLFILGTPSMISEFEAAGYISLSEDTSIRPDVLVVAFDTTLVYKRLCAASWWASQGIPYIATNPDRVCPTDLDTVLVDCGSLCKCIEHATGRCPDIVIGKPNPDMLEGIKHMYNLDGEEIAMCGDRIYTDVATAQNAGAFGVLVLSGESTLVDVEKAERKPDVTAKDIQVFGRLLLESKL